ncbi:phosphoribosylglycinamide formyltransferase [Desulfomicrobium baculatum]|uniref:Phosphoribosylglycinamide formyltransferase n=1 Tax=Desulfomicrobium baculatum (strain DSM 4028 / VKM B-1378 / X) TaxID=525897 RepID=C7LRL9_DESBD|nr:phosphoribosylglycinamide formyltransferase [Desulfomicrobium baculatum]ACU90527.1 phosphoribosylglycinamide formyltransferase [Desulfomicrobium baculatum DSM 4028]
MTIALGVLVSGSGSNLQAIIDRVGDGSLDADIRIVIANKPDAQGLERARKAGIATACVRHDEFPERESFDRELVRLLREAEARFVALAGFMRILTPVFLTPFAGRVINIHPALLPACPGLRAQEQQAGHGVRLAGCTVHFVDEEMDHGPIIIQAAVPAYADDDEATLGARILEMEHRIYPQALQWIAQDRVQVVGRQVVVRGASRTMGTLWANPPLERPFDS